MEAAHRPVVTVAILAQGTLQGCCDLASLFSSHGLSCVAMDMFPERQALCLVDVKQVYYDWPRAPIADKWIPFGEHPLKLDDTEKIRMAPAQG